MGRVNIILILADDMGYGDCGVYNPESKITTPHIDQLAGEGLLFADAHSAASTCTPSRYGLLTGINPVRTGVLNTLLSRGDPIIAENEKTLATMLRDRGYVTRMIGKWHLGFEEDKSGKRPFLDFSKPLKGGPLDRGFDSFYGLHSSPGSSPLCFVRDRTVVSLPTEKGIIQKTKADGTKRDVSVMMSPGYRPEDASPSFCREALKIIREQAAAKDAKPLFLYYASPIPHQPWAPSAAFKGKSGVGDYGDFVMQLDDVVGQINRALKETGLDKDTLLIFTSDNGAGPKAVKVMAGSDHASSATLRGQKADSWEGGHRIPFIAKWPGRIAANEQTRATINFTDLFATVAALLNVDPAKRYPDSATDSHSFLSVLLDPSQAYRRPGLMFNRGGVRDGDWKLVSKTRVRNMATVKPTQSQLFNLSDDLSEKHDLSKAHPERAERLFAEFKKFADERELK
ncbi:MAG: arylsulfatase [Verrucomicrobia bacterium]|nr:arylsulfatase [Verrucomicrobiota bacterium]